MGALSGTLATRSRAALAAGCDLVLHCNGDLAEMSAVAGSVPELTGVAAARAQAALAQRSAPEQFDIEQARALFARMIGGEQLQGTTIS
jgi:beta-N-acetylhexosaminidase